MINGRLRAAGQSQDSDGGPASATGQDPRDPPGGDGKPRAIPLRRLRGGLGRRLGLVGLLLAGLLSQPVWAEPRAENLAPAQPQLRVVADQQPEVEAEAAPEQGEDQSQERSSDPDGSDESDEGREVKRGSRFEEAGTGRGRSGGDEGFGLGSALPDPTALFGPSRFEPVLQEALRASTFSVSGHYIHKLSEDRRLIFEGNLDPTFLGADISYAWQPQGTEDLWTANFHIASSRFAPFVESHPQVRLQNWDRPFLQEAGFGVEYSRKLSENLMLAAALNYQNFGFSDELLGGTRYPQDFTGTPLTYDMRGTGDIFGLRVHALYSDLDHPDLPTEGTSVRFAVEQAVGLGHTSGPFSRAAINAAHLVRVPGFNDGPHSLLLNLQAGTSLGKLPNIRGYYLGGPNSVRGFEPAGMAGGSSFVQGTMEYRHHLTDFELFDYDIGVRGILFADYGSVLGTERELLGVSSLMWNKPTDAFGYGAGLQFATDMGLFRLDAGWNSFGGNAFSFSIGERF